jgi:hypothetical protein
MYWRTLFTWGAGSNCSLDLSCRGQRYDELFNVNANGRIDEDESGWSCVDNGNRICGPGNPQGAPAGRYDEGGVLVDPWPVDGYN